MPYLALVLCTVIWGATFPATKVALAQVQPFTFLFLRFLLGTLLVLGLFLWLRRVLRFDRDVLKMGAVATVFLFIGYAAQTVGLRYTTASNSAFITALYVVLVPLFLRRFDRRTWLAASVALIGLWVLVNPRVTINQGDLWTLLCAGGFAGHIACLERYTRMGQSPSLLVWQLTFITVVMLPAMVIEAPDVHHMSPTPELLIALMVCGVLATGALSMQVWAQKFVLAPHVALIFILEPVCAAWMSWYVLGERLGAQGWVGSGLILVALFLGSISRRASTVPTAAETPARGGRNA